MSLRKFVSTCACAAALVLLLVPASALADVIVVPAGGDLQSALNAARPGDTIQLEPGATYTGNFTLPVHGGTTYVTVRTGGSDALLPASGTRISPSYSKYLARIQSPTMSPALATKPAAAYWRIALVEFGANKEGRGDIVTLGNGSSAQNSLSLVPHHLILDRVYLHGDPLHGQKRGIAINSASTTIVNSYLSEFKAVAQDSQAIAGSNGPGPYHIENNYLEGAGQVFLLGGDDPRITGLVPSDLLFRRNVLSRPLSWRDPIIAAPSGLSASTGTGGTLGAGKYTYRVTARRPAGATTASSARSVEVAATVAAGGAVTIRWQAVPNATEYRVYGRTAGAQNVYWTVKTTSFTDTGSAGTAGTPPSAGTVWQVKNIFELKNTRRARIDYNVMENNWRQAQSGMAVLFTVRNQYGGCTWCVVEQIDFEYNIVRHVAGGLTLHGIDYLHPSQQSKAIRIRHNEFSDVDKSWGGSGYVLQFGENPRDVEVDHNTFISNSGAGILFVGGPPMYGFKFTNNVARHNSYGLFGDGMGYGNTATGYYFPDADIRRNVMSGGKASMYPSDNLFPTTTEFAACFVDYTRSDYALNPACPWRGLGTDGTDLGANYAQMRARTVPSVERPRIGTQTLPPTVELDAYSATLTATGGTAPYRWGIADGNVPLGLMLDAVSGIISGAASAAGDYEFTVEVSDSRGFKATQPLLLHVERAIHPVQILTQSLPNALATMPYTHDLQATGGLGTYTWKLSGGTLPAGVTLTASGDLQGTPAAAGTFTFGVTVADAAEPTRNSTRSFVLTVVRPPNQPPTVRVTTNASATVAVGAPVTLTAEASDVDGVVRNVEFLVNGQSIGSDASAPFTWQWTARDGGPHAISARATDDDGAPAMSNKVTVNTTSEIVIYANAVSRMVGNFQLTADATAANGQRLWNPNKGTAKLAAATATPATYAEFTFYAEAGRAYRIWMRGKADSNSWPNDSIYLQFSGTVDAAGTPVCRIGTSGASWYSLEEDSGVGLSGWGWQDNGFGLNVMGPNLYFERTGLQTLRLQQREDGLSIDQIVISPSKYLTARPGLPKNDATIIAK